MQEILLAVCPTVGVRSGASLVISGETGVLVDRLPPGRQCVETEEDERALEVLLEATERAQAMDRADVRSRTVEEFGDPGIMDAILAALQTARLRGSVAATAIV